MGDRESATSSSTMTGWQIIFEVESIKLNWFKFVGLKDLKFTNTTTTTATTTTTTTTTTATTTATDVIVLEYPISPSYPEGTTPSPSYRLPPPPLLPHIPVV